MVTKAQRTCEQCGKVLKTPWGVRVHKSRVHASSKRRYARRNNKSDTNGAVPSSLMVMHCPGCGFPIHRLRIVDDARL